MVFYPARCILSSQNTKVMHHIGSESVVITQPNQLLPQLLHIVYTFHASKIIILSRSFAIFTLMKRQWRIYECLARELRGELRILSTLDQLCTAYQTSRQKDMLQKVARGRKQMHPKLYYGLLLAMGAECLVVLLYPAPFKCSTLLSIRYPTGEKASESHANLHIIHV